MRTVFRLSALVAFCALFAGCASLPWGRPRPEPEHVPPASYWLYVGAESADLLHRIRFAPGGAVVENTIGIGELPVDIEGPHGLVISPDGRYLYVTTGHGIPDGKLWKIETGVDSLVGRPILLGRFPASLDLTPDGLFAFVSNFNLYGDMVPSTVSVVFTDGLIELERIETCAMPHGGRLGRSGLFHYSVCMMDDQLVEIDTRTFQLARRFSVAHGAEAPIHEGATQSGPGAGGQGSHGSCSPTWVQPAPEGGRLWVACNASDELLEIDVAEWRLLRKLPTGRGPYNLASSPDGRWLVVTLRQGGAVQFFDLWDQTALPVSVPTSTTVVHGVVISPDSRYAFISVEGMGAEPGKVDVIQLETLARVASVEVGQQAAGIAFWRMEPLPPVQSAAAVGIR